MWSRCPDLMFEQERDGWSLSVSRFQPVGRLPEGGDEFEVEPVGLPAGQGSRMSVSGTPSHGAALDPISFFS
jgi:hypothetical protein